MALQTYILLLLHTTEYSIIIATHSIFTPLIATTEYRCCAEYVLGHALSSLLFLYLFLHNTRELKFEDKRLPIIPHYSQRLLIILLFPNPYYSKRICCIIVPGLHGCTSECESQIGHCIHLTQRVMFMQQKKSIIIYNISIQAAHWYVGLGGSYSWQHFFHSQVSSRADSTGGTGEGGHCPPPRPTPQSSCDIKQKRIMCI